MCTAPRLLAAWSGSTLPPSGVNYRAEPLPAVFSAHEVFFLLHPSWCELQQDVLRPHSATCDQVGLPSASDYSCTMPCTFVMVW